MAKLVSEGFDLSSFIKDAKFEWSMNLNKAQLVDYKVFGNSKTYNIPYKKVKYTYKYTYPKADFIIQPQDIGLKGFPEIEKIAVGGCIGEDTHRDFIPWYGAHTHSCRREKNNFKAICVISLSQLKYADGSPSDLLWHEYGHILACDVRGGFKGIKPSCTKRKGHAYTLNGSTDPLTFDKVQDFYHGKTWLDIMIKLGKPHLNSRFLPIKDEEYSWMARIDEKLTDLDSLAKIEKFNTLVP